MTDDRIALIELLEKSGDATFLREMLGFVATRLMALETDGLCGAGPGERSPERINHRNGYRERRWDTRAGTLDLRIPSSGKAATSRPSSRRARPPRRHWSSSCRRRARAHQC